MGHLATKLLEPPRSQLQKPGVSQHPEDVCLMAEGGEDPSAQSTLEPLVISSVRAYTRRLLMSPQAPVQGVPACLPAPE